MNITNVLYSMGCLLWSRLVLNGLRITSCASNPEVYSNKSGKKSSLTAWQNLASTIDQYNEVPKLPHNIIDRLSFQSPIYHHLLCDTVNGKGAIVEW